MIRGIYTAAAGMGVEQARMDVLSQNLINTTTNGYKKDSLVQQPFAQLFLVQKKQEKPDILSSKWENIGRSNQGAAVSQVVTNFSPGLLQKTGNSNHLALGKQNCFFVINSPTPEEPFRTLYTRDGAFSVNGEGYLVTARSGSERVLGERGPISVGSEKFYVSKDGAVSIPGQGEIDKLRLAEFTDLTVLNKTGNNCYTAPPGVEVPAKEPDVLQGFLEKSNVIIATEMVNMLTVVRCYEANAMSLKTHDDLLNLAVNQLGSLK